MKHPTFERAPRAACILVPVIAALLGAASSSSHADAVTRWNANAGDVAAAACFTPAPDGNPLVESRLYAMTQLAVYDAVNAIRPRSEPYAYRGAVQRHASPEAAIAAAAHDVLATQIPLSGVPAACVSAGLARLEDDYAQSIAAIPGGPAKDAGIAVGRAAAAAVVARRTGDGSEAPMVDPAFPQGTVPGQWRFTPGSPPVAFGPSWGKVRPFALREAAQFRPRPPLAVACDSPRVQQECERYAKDVEEIRRLGSDGVSAPSARTPEQTEIALFWLESSPMAWNRIARTLSENRRADLWTNARLFALLNAAQADGYIASWATKFHYLFWRPVTAIREADRDGNPGTTGDPNWMSLAATPPVPDYESAHAVQGAAAAEVIARVLGPGSFAFAQCSFSLPANRCDGASPTLRHFQSLVDAARENGESRILAGYHFRDAVEKGLEEGRQIGAWTVRHLLRAHEDRAAE